MSSDFIVDNDKFLKEYKGNDIDVVIPDGVICIDYHAFYKCKTLIM